MVVGLSGVVEDPEESAVGVEVNPFRLPAGDAEVFRFREEERKKRAEARQRERSLPIWEKPAKRGTSVRARLQEMLGGDESDVVESKVVRKTREIVAEARNLVASERRQEKENMTEFIVKKREMFLVQMSLDTKREEIRKLEAKAQAKEDTLKKSEQMLEEDAIRFDAFLKDNDKKAHEAIKKAERETKFKTDKVHEIKRLNQQIQMVTADTSKQKEALEDCLKYKAFLDSLTPEEWIAEQRAIKRDRQQARRAARMAQNNEKLYALRKEQFALRAQQDNDEDALTESSMTISSGPTRPRKRVNHGGRGGSSSSSSRPRRSMDSNGRATPKAAAVAPTLAEPLAEDADEDVDSSGDELPMFFRRPQQLLDVFAQLEEENLFLIQNSQETEQALEELKQNFVATKSDMDGKTELLKRNISVLEAQIADEERKASQLRSRLGARAGETQGRQETLLAMLHDKVRDVYVRCGFDCTSKPATLFMLSELEAKLECLLEQVDTMPEDYILKEEKEKEKKRRERKRAEQQALQDALQEERNRKSIERSLQAPKKRTGRPVMFRSPPIRKTVKHKKEDDTKDDEDEIKHLT